MKILKQTPPNKGPLLISLVQKTLLNFQTTGEDNNPTHKDATGHR
jgi:hypothetical protein